MLEMLLESSIGSIRQGVYSMREIFFIFVKSMGQCDSSWYCIFILKGNVFIPRGKCSKHRIFILYEGVIILREICSWHRIFIL